MAAAAALLNWLQTFKRHGRIEGTIIIHNNNNGLDGRIRTILHLANENERYTHSPHPAASTHARARTHNHVRACMNMTHTQNWAILTIFDSIFPTEMKEYTVPVQEMDQIVVCPADLIKQHHPKLFIVIFYYKRMRGRASLRSLRMECSFRRRCCRTSTWPAMPPSPCGERCGTMYKSS